MTDKHTLSLATLVQWLLDDACAAGRYVLRAYLIQFIPVVVLGLCLSALLDGPGTSRPSRPGSLHLGMLILAPVVENLLMVGALSLLSGVHSPARRAAIVGLIFGILHALVTPLGIVAVWSFFVFGMTFLGRSSHGFWHAYLVSVAVHALGNVVPAVALVVL
jgi:hypothetical protein